MGKRFLFTRVDFIQFQPTVCCRKILMRVLPVQMMYVRSNLRQRPNAPSVQVAPECVNSIALNPAVVPEDRKCVTSDKLNLLMAPSPGEFSVDQEMVFAYLT